MPTPISYHSGARGLLGFLKYITGSDGVARGGVVPAVSLVDSDGNASGAGTASSPTVTTPATNATYQLAGTQGGTGATLAAGASSTPVAVEFGQSYIWAYQFAGTTTLVLESLGPDGVTFAAFTPAASATASGQQGVTTGANPGKTANVRIRNTGANPATSLFSSLS